MKTTVDVVNKFFEEGDGEILHFTHVSDADGIGCEALSKFLNDSGYNIEVVRVSYNSMQKVICEYLESDMCPKRVLITDLSVDETVRSLLIEKGVRFFWIDHHTINPMFNDEVMADPRFFIYNREYPTRLFSSWFCSDRVFNPNRYKTETVKYSAFALYYIVIQMLEGDVSNAFSADVEEILVEPLSNADTYHFKYLKDARGWITTDMDDCEELPKSMTSIADVYSLILKHQGAEALINVITYIINDAVTDLTMLTMHVDMARLTHRKRVDEYKFFKRSCVPLMIGKTKMVFTPNPTADFSIFSSWLFEEDPSIAATFGVFMESRTVTMRSPDDPDLSETYDVARFCREFLGGGGHIHAAGGKIERGLLIAMMSAYYTIRDYHADNRDARITARIISNNLHVTGFEIAE